MKFSRSDFEMQRFVSNAYGIGSRSKCREMRFVHKDLVSGRRWTERCPDAPAASARRWIRTPSRSERCREVPHRGRLLLPKLFRKVRCAMVDGGVEAKFLGYIAAFFRSLVGTGCHEIGLA